MTDKKPNAWAVQFKVDGEWLTQTWHKDKEDARAEMETDRYTVGIPFRITETYFKWPE